jgi:translocation and assembly module TamB
MVRILRVLLIGLGAVLGLVLLTVLAGIAALRTETGKVWVTAEIATLASSPDMTIAIGRIDGSLPFDWTVDQVTLADREGVWLTLDGLGLRLRARDLLARKVTIERLAARSIQADRLPRSTTPASAATTDRAGFSLPHLPVAIDLQGLDIGRVTLAAPVAGQPVALTIDGKGDLGGGAAHAILTVARVDGIAGAGELALGFVDRQGATDATLDLSLHAEDPTGVLLRGGSAALVGHAQRAWTPRRLARHASGTGRRSRPDRRPI